MPNPLEQAKLAIPAEFHMFSGCKDDQTSSDVSNVKQFKLPDPQGKAGGALTSALLNVTYADHQDTGHDLTYQETLEEIRYQLESMGFSQIPQLSSSRPMKIKQRTFDLVPDNMKGKRRAVLIGINYVGHKQGELRGCHNDVYNMVDYLINVHKFTESNITILIDDGEHISPTRANIITAFQSLVKKSKSGDAVVVHFSGHGGKVIDDDGDEDDGYDETLVPLDYKTSGQIRDDDIYDILVQPMKKGVFATCIMDCCHSGSVLDLPFTFAADGKQPTMSLSVTNMSHLLSKPNVPTSIVLIDARPDALTVSWPAKKWAVGYVLEYRATVDKKFVPLADNLIQPQARKRNLYPDFEYIFRVAAIYEDDSIGPWCSHKEPFRPLDYDLAEYCMAPPIVSNSIPEKGALHLQWEEIEEAYEYELQYRPNISGAEWEDQRTVTATEIKETNLSPGIGYQFRIRPVTDQEEPWSEPSEVVIPKTTTSHGKKKPTKHHQQQQPPPKPQVPDNGAMARPWCKNGGMKHAILVCWQNIDWATGYELQMKEARKPKLPWNTIASCLTGTEVRKKNCTSKNGYIFRVKPLGGTTTKQQNVPFSEPSYAAMAP